MIVSLRLFIEWNQRNMCVCIDEDNLNAINI
jgi:hypothetical protein